MATPLRRFSSALAVVLLLATTSFARPNGNPPSPQSTIWIQVKGFNQLVRTVTFLDSSANYDIGFVGLNDGQLWRTSDAGTNWTMIRTFGVPITSFSFIDSMTGWVSLENLIDQEGCYKTTDGGLTWSPQGQLGTKSCVYYHKATHLVFLTSPFEAISVSSNYGQSWDVMDNPGKEGVAFSTDSIGIITNALGKNIRTQDGGKTWIDGKLSASCWQPLAIPGTKTFFAVSETQRSVFRTDDGGNVWKFLHQFTGDTVPTGHINGDCSQLFIQTNHGVAYSLDAGVNWTDMGIANIPATRFFYANLTLYAAENTILYKKGVDAPTNIDPILLSHDTLTFKPRGCANVDSTLLIFSADGCSPSKLVVADLSGSPNFSITPPGLLPAPVTSIKVSYQSNETADDQGSLRLIFQRNATRFDTLFVKLFGRRTPALDYTVTPTKLNLTAESGCVTIDTFVTVRAGACDTLHLTQASFNNAAFTAPGLQLPVDILPGGFLRVPISATTKANGLQSGFLHLQLTNKETFRDTNIQIFFQIRNAFLPTLKLTGTTFNFPNTNLCNTKQVTVVMENIMCKNVKIQSIAWNPGAPEFTILSQPAAGRDLAPGEKDSMVVKYAPTATNTANAIVRVKLDMEGIGRDTLIRFSGNGTASESSSLGRDTLVFDSIRTCETEILETYLHSDACTAVTVSAIDNTSTNGYSVLEPAVGATIPAGDSVKVRVLLDPNSPGQKKDVVTFTVKFSGGAEQQVTLKLESFIQAPLRSIELSTNTITLDNIDGCKSYDTVIWIKNHGTCDDISLGNFTVTSAANWFSVLNQPAGTFKPGDSVGFKLHVVPGTESIVTATLTLGGVDTTISISISSTPCSTGPKKNIVFSSQPPVFNTVSCKKLTMVIPFSNTGSENATIDQLTINSTVPGQTQFYFNPPITSLLVPAKSIANVMVEFDPDGVGNYSATLHVASADAAYTQDIGMTANVTNPKVTTRLSFKNVDGSTQLQAYADHIFHLAIITEDPIPAGVAVQTLDYTLNFNTDLVDVVKVDGLNGWTADPPDFTATSMHVRLHATSFAGNAPNDQLADITARLDLAIAKSTVITSSTTRFNESDANFERCTLASIASNDQYSVAYQDLCGDEINRHGLTNDLALFLAMDGQIEYIPTTVSLRYHLARESDVRLEVYNATGLLVNAFDYSDVKSGDHKVSIPVASLTQGSYFVRVSAGKAVASTRFVITR